MDFEKYLVGATDFLSRPTSDKITGKVGIPRGDETMINIGRLCVLPLGNIRCPADLLDFQLPTTGTSQRPTIDPMQTHVA